MGEGNDGADIFECQVVTWYKELALENRQDRENTFKWDKVVKTLPVTYKYDCCWPWLYKEMIYGSIADDMFVYMDDGQTIGPKDEVCWEASRKWGST